MLDGSNGGLSAHPLSLIAALSGGIIGYSLSQWISGSKAAAHGDIHRINAGQLGSSNKKQEEPESAPSQKADPYDPRPRQG